MTNANTLTDIITAIGTLGSGGTLEDVAERVNNLRANRVERLRQGITLPVAGRKQVSTKTVLMALKELERSGQVTLMEAKWRVKT